jgi:hypothetical protein
MEYTESSLRSGTDILNRGGSVTTVYKDKTFRMLYDNRRLINDKPFIDDLRDSKPVESLDTVKYHRFVSKLSIHKNYNKNVQSVKVACYKSNLDVAVRSFVRGLFTESYNLNMNDFGSYKNLSNFINGFKGNILKDNTIASLKRRPLNKRSLLVGEDAEVLNFVKYIKENYPNFNDKLFLS